MNGLSALTGNRYISEMLAACFLVMLPHEKRKHFWLRVTTFCAVVEVVSFL